MLAATLRPGRDAATENYPNPNVMHVTVKRLNVAKTGPPWGNGQGAGMQPDRQLTAWARRSGFRRAQADSPGSSGYGGSGYKYPSLVGSGRSGAGPGSGTGSGPGGSGAGNGLGGVGPVGSGPFGLGCIGSGPGSGGNGSGSCTGGIVMAAPRLLDCFRFADASSAYARRLELEQGLHACLFTPSRHLRPPCPNPSAPRRHALLFR